MAMHAYVLVVDVQYVQIETTHIDKTHVKSYAHRNLHKRCRNMAE